MKNTRLNISGMHCGGCVKSVTKVLETLDGVAQAEVFLEGYADIQYDESKVSVAQLIEAIEDAGFDAKA